MSTDDRPFTWRCRTCGMRFVDPWQVVAAANFGDGVARHVREDTERFDLCGPVEDAADDPDDRQVVVDPSPVVPADTDAPIGHGLVLATDAEHALIERLALVVGHRLLLEWDAVDDADRVLSMNRAALSALARALGTFLAAVASVQPENEAGWLVVVEHALAIARQTAREKRRAMLASPDGGALVRDDPTKPVYVFPAPDAVM